MQTQNRLFVFNLFLQSIYAIFDVISILSPFACIYAICAQAHARTKTRTAKIQKKTQICKKYGRILQFICIFYSRLTD